MTYKRKLIEVALPLEAINKESAREKSIRHGHPSTLHLWWARRPLAACRAVLFASLVDDPSAHPDKFPTDEDQERERKRLFAIIEELVKWENSNDEKVLAAAKAEIMRSTDGKPPPVLDPFCGGGSIPLEAQRLGLEAHASDLNPVAVLITKALIEIPPKFAGRPPVNPDSQSRLGTATWKGAQGLAEDIRYYGKWMRAEAYCRIGHLYPKARLANGDEAPAIAWLWARTITCPNPTCRRELPLVQNFWLSRRRGKVAWIQPVIDRERRSPSFRIVSGNEGGPPDGTVGRSGARCLFCDTVVPLGHVRELGQRNGFPARLMAIVAQGNRGRIFLAPDHDHEDAARVSMPVNVPDARLPETALGFRVQKYGFGRFQDLYSPRQLLALMTFLNLINDVKEHAADLSSAAGTPDPRAYPDAVATYVTLAVSKATDLCSALCHWQPNAEQLKLAPTFMRPALPMAWDYAEGNPFSDFTGNFYRQFDLVAKVLETLPRNGTHGQANQLDARTLRQDSFAVATDPPYYDNIGYADLSDFFYLWLRRGLIDIYPSLFATLLTPKEEELVASPRFEKDPGGAAGTFEKGLENTFGSLHAMQSTDVPMTLFYAFKQAEATDDGGIASTGWETMLSGLLATGFEVTGTWPIRTERVGRPRNYQSNALASSVILVCRPRRTDQRLATRQQFIKELRERLPEALKNLQHGNIAPVDLAQASIGPGMAVFSRYSKVVEADGSAMRVRTALELINQVLSEVLTEQEDDYDSPTRWAIAWFEQFGLKEGPFGQADVLARAMGTAINALVQDGIVHAGGGKVRLLRPDELLSSWDPVTDSRVRVWEVAHYLVRALEADGEQDAAAILRKVGSLGDIARDLAYRLYVTCERKKWAQEALGYNALVVAWPEIQRLAGREPTAEEQVRLSI